jgi:hypothetical protein
MPYPSIRKKAAPAAVVLWLMLLAAGGAFAQSNGNSTQSQIANLQSQINTVQSNLDTAKAQLQAAIQSCWTRSTRFRPAWTSRRPSCSRPSPLATPPCRRK